MKRILTVAFALLSFMSVSAQKLTVANVNIKAGESGVAVVNFEAPVECKALQMTMVLPEGIEIPYDAEEEEWGVENGSLLHKKYSVDINKTDNVYKFLVYRNISDPKFNALSGDLLNITLSVAAGVTADDLDVTIKDITVNNLASEPVEGFADVTFKVGVGKEVPTGISSINAEEQGAAIYNLAGQKVSKAQKGVFIKNGKKVVVK
jgi:hypothetical protein